MDAPAPPEPASRRLPLPTTFGGMAALAQGPGWWLTAWQILVATVSALVLVWAVEVVWGRGLARAVAALPDKGSIRNGRLEWPETTPRVLHGGSYLAIAVDPEGRGGPSLASDVALCLEPERVVLRSIMGSRTVPYPAALNLSLARLDFSGAMSAWKGPVLLTLGVLTFFGLLTAWWLLGTVYATVMWILAVPIGRKLNWITAWRLAGAALLPGAILMTAALALYATRQLGLIGLVVALPAHIVVGWGYCVGGWTRLRRETKASGNPFDSRRTLDPERPSPVANPFQVP